MSELKSLQVLARKGLTSQQSARLARRTPTPEAVRVLDLNDSAVKVCCGWCNDGLCTDHEADCVWPEMLGGAPRCLCPTKELAP